MVKFGILILTAFMALNCQSQFKGKAYEHASIGFSLVNVARGEQLAQINAEKSLAPASVLKLVTTATALEILGPDYKYTTTVGSNVRIEGGLLKGDLVIKGTGDPSLGSRYVYKDMYAFMDKWIIDLKQKGLKKINGSIIADVSLYYPEPVPTRWIWEDIGNYYGAGVYALTCFDNYYELGFHPAKVGAKARISTIDPEVPGMHFLVEAVGSPVNKDSAYIYGGPYQMEKIVRGAIPANKMNFSIRGAIPNPPLVLVQTLKRKLKASGIEVKGDAKVSLSPIEVLHVLSQTVSPNVKSIAKILNFMSNNLFAEHLLKSLAPDKDVAGNIRLLKDFWKDKGLETTACFLYDGSGLSPSNAVSPHFLTALLSYMSNKSSNAVSFREVIPEAGKEGTVQYFLKKQDEAKVWAKSGSMDNTRCYAGYIEKGGETFAFSIMVNKFTCTQKEVVKDIESFLLDQIKKL